MQFKNPGGLCIFKKSNYEIDSGNVGKLKNSLINRRSLSRMLSDE